MSERSVVITGASTGIGAATALHLDEQGWRVFAGVRREQDAEALRSRASERLRPLHLDVTETATLRGAAEEVAGAVGSAGLDALVCNAGIGVGGPLEFVDLEEVRRQLEVNVVGVVATLQAFLPLVRMARGRVVITGSIGGRVASPFLGPYAASKHALEALADSLRVELMPWGIHVALLEPGAIATPMWDKASDTAAELRSTLPPEALRLYEPAIAAVEPTLERQRSAGIPARRVADAVSHALTSPRPRTRYLVGRDARAAARVRRLVPDRAWDRMVARYMHLPHR